MNTKSYSGKLKYKCRLCKKIIENMCVPDIRLALIAIQSDFKNIGTDKVPWLKDLGAQNLHGIHFCNEDKVGITDLIGGEIDK